MDNPDNFETARIQFQQILNNLQKEKYEEAELNFLKSLKLVPDRLSTINNLISVYIATEQKNKLKKILELHKHLINENELQYGVAHDYFFDKNYSKSIEICKKLIILDQFRFAISDLLASIFKKQKLFLDAIKIYKIRLKEKKDYLIYYKIGCFFYDLGRVNKAYYYFTKI